MISYSPIRRIALRVNGFFCSVNHFSWVHLMQITIQRIRPAWHAETK